MLIELDNVTKTYRHRGIAVAAAERVSFGIAAGETVGLVGESGSGKSTVGRCIIGLTAPDAGAVRVAGAAPAAPGARRRKLLHRRLQMVFQDPAGSMNPAYSVEAWLGDALHPHRLSRRERRARSAELLEQVGLGGRFLERRSRELSGGQLQRVGIARALAAEPEFIFLDEPTSALDLSVQGQIVNLLTDLQRDRGLAYLFATHDLRVVSVLARRIVVMYLGRVVEDGPADTVLSRPAHPYTQSLLRSAGLGTRRPRGRSPADPVLAAAGGGGCPYVSRCELAQALCREEEPQLEPVAEGHRSACVYAPSVQHVDLDSASAFVTLERRIPQGGKA
ncbi:MAG: ABC transporter ATP-binding protein [Gaiellales bacterium]